jgi:hypothetical protein
MAVFWIPVMKSGSNFENYERCEEFQPVVKIQLNKYTATVHFPNL